MNIKLKKQKDFNLVFSKGSRVYSKSLTLLFIKKLTEEYDKNATEAESAAEAA